MHRRPSVMHRRRGGVPIGDESLNDIPHRDRNRKKARPPMLEECVARRTKSALRAHLGQPFTRGGNVTTVSEQR